MAGTGGTSTGSGGAAGGSVGRSGGDGGTADGGAADGGTADGNTAGHGGEVSAGAGGVAGSGPSVAGGSPGTGGDPTSAGAAGLGGAGSDCDDGLGAQCDCKNGAARPCGQCNGGTQTCVSGAWSECVDKLALPTAKGPALICVPGGTFMMGGGDLVEAKPVHSVTVSRFWMAETEVTASQYQVCVDAGACDGQSGSHLQRHSGNEACTLGWAGAENFALNCIDVDWAATYCAWTGGRLPTEEEWEYAARGTDGRLYVWGNSTPADSDLRWLAPTVGAGKSYPRDKSPFGIYDLAGNVAEWTSSVLCNYTASGKDLDSCSTSVVYRGGSYSNTVPIELRAARRYFDVPPAILTHLGFRCANDVAP